MVSKIPLTVTPFRLPLTREQFADALRKGHGRALMHVRRHGVSGVDDLVVDACARSLVYDAQCEVGREDWLLRMIDAVPRERAALLSRVIEHFAAPVDNESKDHYQRRRFAHLLAMRGDARYVEYQYRSLDQVRELHRLYLETELVEADGARGLVYVARRIGECMPSQSEEFVGPNPLKLYDEKHGEGAGRRLLDAEAAGDENIARYLRKLDEIAEAKAAYKRERAEARKRGKAVPGEESPLERHRREVRSLPLADVLERIRSTVPGKHGPQSFYRAWGRSASEEDRRAITAALFEDDGDRAEYYLACLLLQGAIEMDERFLRFSKHESWFARRNAHAVMAHHRHPLVRKHALDRIRSDEVQADELELLTKNYEPGDWGFICEHVTVPDGEYELHRIVSNVVDLYSSNNNDDARLALEFVYEHSPCTNCRQRAVLALVEFGRLADWIREECAFDTTDLIRETVDPAAKLDDAESV